VLSNLSKHFPPQSFSRQRIVLIKTKPHWLYKTVQKLFSYICLRLLKEVVFVMSSDSDEDVVIFWVWLTSYRKCNRAAWVREFECNSR